MTREQQLVEKILQHTKEQAQKEIGENGAIHFNYDMKESIIELGIEKEMNGEIYMRLNVIAGISQIIKTPAIIIIEKLTGIDFESSIDFSIYLNKHLTDNDLITLIPIIEEENIKRIKRD